MKLRSRTIKNIISERAKKEENQEQNQEQIDIPKTIISTEKMLEIWNDYWEKKPKNNNSNHTSCNN